MTEDVISGRQLRDHMMLAMTLSRYMTAYIPNQSASPLPLLRISPSFQPSALSYSPPLTPPSPSSVTQPSTTPPACNTSGICPRETEKPNLVTAEAETKCPPPRPPLPPLLHCSKDLLSGHLTRWWENCLSSYRRHKPCLETLPVPDDMAAFTSFMEHT